MHMVHACRRQAIARYQSDMYSLLIRLSGLLAIFLKKTKQTIQHECRIFWLKIPYSLSDFVVSSRLLFANFWTLKLSRAMTIRQMKRKRSQMVRHISAFFLKKIIVILITFNSWFYWWSNTNRKWVGDPTT